MNNPNAHNKAENLISLAEHHARDTVGWKSSAELCIRDAVELFKAGDYESACRRALHSLKYTIGISHADYIAASKAVNFSDVPQYPEVVPTLDEIVQVKIEMPDLPIEHVDEPVTFGPEQDRIDAEFLGRGMSIAIDEPVKIADVVPPAPGFKIPSAPADIRQSSKTVSPADVRATFNGQPLLPGDDAFVMVARPVDIDDVRRHLKATFKGHRIEAQEVGIHPEHYLRYNLAINFGDDVTYCREFSCREFDVAHAVRVAEQIGRIAQYHATVSSLRKLLARYDMLVNDHVIKTAISAVPLCGWRAAVE